MKYFQFHQLKFYHEIFSINLNIKLFLKNLNILIKIPKFEKKENIPFLHKERLFFIHLIKQNEGLYNIVNYLYFIGNLNVNNFKKSFDLIIKKHEQNLKFKMEKHFKLLKMN
jgi:hypothetical protein